VSIWSGENGGEAQERNSEPPSDDSRSDQNGDGHSSGDPSLPGAADLDTDCPDTDSTHINSRDTSAPTGPPGRTPKPEPAITSAYLVLLFVAFSLGVRKPSLGVEARLISSQVAVSVFVEYMLSDANGEKWFGISESMVFGCKRKSSGQSPCLGGHAKLASAYSGRFRSTGEVLTWNWRFIGLDLTPSSGSLA
jgi:hypothetical protein